MKNINVCVNLNASHTQQDVGLKKMIVGKLKRLGRDKGSTEERQNIYWLADFFGLQKSTLFNKLHEKQQFEIVTLCNRHLLQEAYFIEKSGLSYCAKMVLLAETTEAAQAYSLIGADEATHLQWISSYLQPPFRYSANNEFLSFLTQLIEEGDSGCLVYLLQIILEGWGVLHYQDLALNCQDIRLKNIFSEIVRDEVLHQHTGTVLFQHKQLSKLQINFIQHALSHFLEMVRVGPLYVIGQVEKVLGYLNKEDKIQLLDEIVGSETTAKKLLSLKQFMSVPGCEKWIDDLNTKKMFEPYAAAQCV